MSNMIRPIRDIPVIRDIDLKTVPEGEVMRFWLYLVSDGLGLPIYIPVIIARGTKPGPTLGVNAVLHGNELNGLPVVQRLFAEIDPHRLSGILVGIPVMNVPSFLRERRRFIDDEDLNRIMPGKEHGNVSQVYAFRIIDRIVRHFDYLIDLHTASFGRVNSYYIRANMDDATTRTMAMLQNADIIVSSPASDKTLRGAAMEMGIPAITLEVGDPLRFQKGMIRSGLTGVYNLMVHLGMVEGNIDTPDQPTVICDQSEWFFTDRGGLLEVPVSITQRIQKGDCIGILRNVFGDLMQEYHAPYNGIIVGKSTNPVAHTGARIVHLGRL